MRKTHTRGTLYTLCLHQEIWWIKLTFLAFSPKRLSESCQEKNLNKERIISSDNTAVEDLLR